MATVDILLGSEQAKTFTELPAFWQSHHHLRAKLPSKSGMEKAAFDEPLLLGFFLKTLTYMIRFLAV